MSQLECWISWVWISIHVYACTYTYVYTYLKSGDLFWEIGSDGCGVWQVQSLRSRPRCRPSANLQFQPKHYPQAPSFLQFGYFSWGLQVIGWGLLALWNMFKTDLGVHHTQKQNKTPPRNIQNQLTKMPEYHDLVKSTHEFTHHRHVFLCHSPQNIQHCKTVSR